MDNPDSQEVPDQLVPLDQEDFKEEQVHQDLVVFQVVLVVLVDLVRPANQVHQEVKVL